ncbi:hypothetical protein [Solimicrobium silvestre]|uniref:Uncharacterized protein n=1 Tax=Solimicrobium silvestre TaxID=2099400 RepID=A0A2S9GT02_9BURK|nr:hypothetical protein [Solimicrobium silvestre]PRC90835.1 hypothetical protein S2091_4498 [Solimicrobium silvestre]
MKISIKNLLIAAFIILSLLMLGKYLHISLLEKNKLAFHRDESNYHSAPVIKLIRSKEDHVFYDADVGGVILHIPTNDPSKYFSTSGFIAFWYPDMTLSAWGDTEIRPDNVPDTKNRFRVFISSLAHNVESAPKGQVFIKPSELLEIASKRNNQIPKLNKTQFDELLSFTFEDSEKTKAIQKLSDENYSHFGADYIATENAPYEAYVSCGGPIDRGGCTGDVYIKKLGIQYHFIANFGAERISDLIRDTNLMIASWTD